MISVMLQFEQRNGRLVEDYPTKFTVEIMNEAGEIPLALTIPEISSWSCMKEFLNMGCLYLVEM